MPSETITSIGHKPAGRWAFDGAVTDCFDDMLARSIPQHDVMRRACFDVGRPFVRRNTDIVDLGCSRGEALAPFVDEFGSLNRFVGLEVSEPMAAAARERFAGMIRAGIVEVRDHDLRAGYPMGLRASLTLSILTLQFVPIEYRQRIVSDAYETTVPGGAFVVVEKVLGADARLDNLFVDAYLGMKAANGYSRDEIDRKRHSLEGVLVPITAAWNEQLLRDAGFSRVDCFWRWMNFAGWVAVKS